jgi:hypothetical protein
VNDLAGTLQLEAALRDAELLFEYAGAHGQSLLPVLGA